MNHIIIAVDGPAASGKGTISKAISEKLQFNYLDTGKLYRAIGAKYLEGYAPIAAAQLELHGSVCRRTSYPLSHVFCLALVRWTPKEEGLVDLGERTPESAVLTGLHPQVLCCPLLRNPGSTEAQDGT